MRSWLLYWIATLAALAIGLASSVRLRWLCDDAFITFRYVQNIARGLGPVYNAGERVEGYTHFLWLLILFAARTLGLEPEAASLAMGILSHLALIVLLALGAARIVPGPARVPMAALAAALHHDLAVWATGGLETPLFTLLVTAGALLLSTLRPGDARRSALCGLLLALATLARPDGIVFLVLGAVWILSRSGGSRGRDLACFLLAAALPLVPHLVWRLAYYGDLLPNPYYAKSGGGFYLSQGLRYVALYLKGYPSTFLLIAAVAAATALARRRPEGPSAVRPALLLFSLFIAVYVLAFVVRVGGDFIYARFLLPVVPLLYLAADISLRSLLTRRPAILTIALLAFPLLSAVDQKARRAIYFDPDGQPRSSYGPSGINDEHWYWSHRGGRGSLLDSYRRIGLELREAFHGSGARVVLGGQASLGYYADFDVCLEAAGLTDREIARQGIERRGRPGHERVASPDLLRRRGVHFVFMKAPIEPDEYRSVYFRIGPDHIRAEMIHYDRALMERLAERLGDRLRFVDFPAYLDEYLLSIGTRPIEEIRRDHARFREFYFRHNPDPEREAPFLGRLHPPPPGRMRYPGISSRVPEGGLHALAPDGPAFSSRRGPGPGARQRAR